MDESTLSKRFLLGPLPARYDREMCKKDTRRPAPGDHYLSDPWPTYTYMLDAGHDGRCDANVAWVGHPKIESSTGSLNLEIMTGGGHGWAAARFNTREQVDGFCAWMQAHADAAWPQSDRSGSTRRSE